MRGSRRKRRKMERCCRRGYHSRIDSRCPSHHHSLVHSLSPQRREHSGRLVAFLYNVFILISLVAVVYFMLEYHCDTCNAKTNLRALTKNIEHIAQNLIKMKNNYQDLESKITMFNEELPRIQGQIEMLDGLSNNMERNHCHMTHMNPKSRTYPHVMHLKYISAASTQRKSPDNNLHCLQSSRINTTVSSPILPPSHVKV